MTETRKEIIDIIKDYMEKDLVEWCLVINKEWIIWKITSNRKENLYFALIDIETNKDFVEFKDEVKILGHYDITAILKYIWLQDSVDRIILSSSITCYEIIYWWEVFILENKSPNLYTEEQEKDLFELLKKLWKN